MGRPVIDETGNRYGRLVVLKRAGYRERNATWHCKCDCGNHCVTTGTKLRLGRKRSCGCLIRDTVTTHGLTNTPEYHAWTIMKQRCTNPNNANYPRWGGRGISVCARWLTSFENFYADMGPRPDPDRSLDRRDNDGDYTPENCRWATRSQQGQNKRNNVLLTHRGITQCLAAWSRDVDLDEKVLSKRLQLGWSDGRALTTPLMTRGPQGG